MRSLVSTEYLNEIIRETMATLIESLLMKSKRLPYDILRVNKEVLAFISGPVYLQESHDEALVRYHAMKGLEGFLNPGP